jgi:hypothetical protein
MESAMFTHLVESTLTGDASVTVVRRMPRIRDRSCAIPASPGTHGRALERADDIDAYLDSLLIDTRGNRMGFPSPTCSRKSCSWPAIRWYLGKDVIPRNPGKPQGRVQLLHRCLPPVRHDRNLGLDLIRDGAWLEPS